MRRMTTPWLKGPSIIVATLITVAAAVAILDLALRLGDFVSDDQLSLRTALWLFVSVLLAFLSLAITVRWVLLNWQRLTDRVEERVHARYKSLIEESTDVFFVIGAQGAIVYASPSADRTLGGRAASNIEEILEALTPADEILVRRALGDRTSNPAPLIAQFNDEVGGHIYELHLNDQTSNPNVRGLVLTGREVTASKRLERHLEEMALKDELTKLPNRWALKSGTVDALARAKRLPSSVLLLVIDLDGFKGINDTLGHPAGDQLLREVARRLESTCRRGELLARLGGDEFAIVLEGVEEVDRGVVLARRIIEEVRAPIAIDDELVSVTASVGLSSGATAVDADDLFKQADIALYDAKGRGRSQISVFRQEMADLVLSQTRLYQEIESGVANGEFSMVYQPLVSLENGRTLAFEALMRWESPVLGPVPPLTFIPVAERTGLILGLGRWAFEESCRRLAEWQQQPSGEGLKMSVNVSMVQLDDPGFLNDVVASLERTGVSPADLQLEVTESIMANDPVVIAARLKTLQNLGFTIALDDFGTGYSSLSQLQQFPVDCIKIDRAFVVKAQSDEEQAVSVLRALIDLASALDADVVAEGVETEAQRDLLLELGVSMGQGYLFAHPVAADDVPLFLSSADHNAAR